MKKSILILIILFTLTGCSNANEEYGYERLDDLEPSIIYNRDDVHISRCGGECVDDSGAIKYDFNISNDYFYDYPSPAIIDKNLVNSSQIVNMYFANYITSEFYWDETYGNDLLSMFEYLDGTNKLYAFFPTYYENILSDEVNGIDYYECPTEGVEYTSENTESECFNNTHVTSLKPATENPTPEEYFNYIDDFNYQTFDYIEYMEFTGYYPTSIIKVYSGEYTEDEAIQLEEDLKQFYNEEYMYINVKIIDDSTTNNITYYDSEGKKQESFDEYDPQYYKLPEDYKPESKY